MNIHNASDSGGGSLRDLLGRNIGRRASASFLVGSYRLVRQEGIQPHSSPYKRKHSEGKTRPPKQRPIFLETHVWTDHCSHLYS